MKVTYTFSKQPLLHSGWAIDAQTSTLNRVEGA